MSATEQFQAVILAGSGRNLKPLTDEKHPKCLLPVANQPMIYYQLKWLEKAQINNIIIVTPPPFNKKIHDYIQKYYETPIDTTIHVHVSDIEDGGTAEAIRSVHHLINTNFIVVSTDLIIDVSPSFILDSHVALNSALTTLFFESKSDNEISREGSLSEDLSDYVGVEQKSSRLLYLTPKSALDDMMAVRVKLLNKFPILNIHTKYQDANLYIFKKWVSDYIFNDKTLRSLRHDVVTMLVKSQYEEKVFQEVRKYMTPTISETYLFAPTALLPGLPSPKNFEENSIVCTALLLDEKKGLCRRANTVSSYLDVNCRISKNLALAERIAVCEISPKTQVGNDSMVGSSTKIGERCSVKRSVVGSHCVIGKNCKIVDSVIMDHVVIEDNVKLEGCVLCNTSKVAEKCQLKECEVTNGYEVERDVVAKGELFV